MQLADNDSDTKINVEESADEDIIRFDLGGTERVTLYAEMTALPVEAVKEQQKMIEELQKRIEELEGR